jgi:hypothetical protein
MTGGSSTEYSLIAYIIIFSTVFFLIISFLGIAQINQVEIGTTPEIDIQVAGIFSDEKVSIFEGFSFYFTNPLTGYWEKLLIGILYFIPLTVIGFMVGANFIRGRG